MLHKVKKRKKNHLLSSFYSHVNINPGNICLTYVNEENIVLEYSYNQVSTLVERLESKLSSLPQGILGLYGNPSPIFLVELITTLKLEMIYLPLDPQLPFQNILEILSSVKDQLVGVIFDGNLFSDLSFDNKTTIKSISPFIAEINPQVDLAIHQNNKTQFIPSFNQGINIAYIMFTTGTTGTPVRVSVPHQCALYNIESIISRLDLNSSVVWPWIAPIGFDPSIVDIFVPLSVGGRLVIIDPKLKLMPNRFVNILRQTKTTVVQCTPSFLRIIGSSLLSETFFNEESLSSVRHLIIGGESFPILREIKSWVTSKPNPNLILHNIYGITEWATMHSVSLVKILSKVQDTYVPPIGIPFDHIILKLDSESSRHLTQGSKERFCILDNEQLDYSTPVWRDTKDIFKFIGNKYFYLGRVNRIIKLFGKKINLLDIENTLMSNSMIQGCTVFVCTLEGSTIPQLAALVATSQVSPSIFIFRFNLIIPAVQDLIFEWLSAHLPRFMRPTLIGLVEELPMNQNRKIDITRAHAIVQQQYKRGYLINNLDYRKLLQKFVTVNSETDLAHTYFVQIGGTSIEALSYIGYLSEYFQIKNSKQRLFNMLLNSPLQKFFDEIELLSNNSTQSSESEVNINIESKNKKSILYPLKVINFVVEISVPLKGTMLSRFGKFQCLDEPASFAVPIFHGSIIIEQFWKYHLWKCIDSSPLIFVPHNQFRNSCVYIGSHSGLFSCVSLLDGNTYWTTKLPDRIESSAILSKFGEYVIVGCYDGNIYFLSSITGEIEWKFQTHGQVKCTPVIDMYTGLIFIGSHSCNLYAIDPKEKSIVWEYGTNKSIFASPLLIEEKRIVVCCDLSGMVYTITFLDNIFKILWTYQHTAPIFSTPLYKNEMIYFTSVDKKVIALHMENGLKKWEFNETKAPIYSTPSIIVNSSTSGDSNIIFGCHDGFLYAVSSALGNLKWKVEVGDQLFSSPIVYTVNNQDGLITNSKNIIIIATTGGKIFCIDENGQPFQKNSVRLASQIFSTPVLVPPTSKYPTLLLVGCRDNFMYCFALK